MEQQTVSVTKLGVMVTMNAKVSILAAASPKGGFWDDGLSLAENIDLPDSMITRFDLIYNLRDIPDAEADGLIADHLLTGGTPNALSRESLTAYMEMVRQLKPVTTPDAMGAIKRYYVGARSRPARYVVLDRVVRPKWI